MSAPGAGEKVCPFCAETIKAAAVKCRFCHSDLPVVEDGELEVADATVIAPLPSEPLLPPPPETLAVPEPPPLVKAPGVRPALSGMVVALLVASVLLAAGSVVLLVTWPTTPERADGLEVGRNGQVVTESYREEAVAAASARAVTVVSYSYATLAEDEAKARAVMTAEFIKEYDKVMAQATPKALAGKLTLKAEIAAASVVSLRPRQAEVLLFVNTTTTSAKSDKQQVDQNRVLMTMTRKDDAWIVSKIDAF